MNKLREVRDEKKLDNKGFSLVELIIVIAIMAVLIGVLAPQYLKYVEKGRASADIDNVDQMISAVVTYSADPAYSTASGTIECANGEIKLSGAVGTVGTIADAMSEMSISIPSGKKFMKSNSYQNWTITFDTDGTMSFSTTDDGPDLQNALGR